MSDYPTRPQTPQVMLHRLPDKPDPSSSTTRPANYIILISASTAVAGKVQIAKSVSNALSCPLFQGDSLHETSAKAASVGVSKRDEQGSASGANEGRYRRMWLSKMTRTGYLFPDESRAANEGFSGFGGASSTSTSRRGSASSVASSSSDAAASISSIASSFTAPAAPNSTYINKPMFAMPEEVKMRKSNPALMVVTHPDLEKWHKDCIRKSVGEYGIGVIFVPLSEDFEDEELPVLKPLDPRTMTSFGSFGAAPKVTAPSLDEEIVLKVNVKAGVEDLIDDIVHGVKDIMNA